KKIVIIFSVNNTLLSLSRKVIKSSTLKAKRDKNQKIIASFEKEHSPPRIRLSKSLNTWIKIG
ncbi:hypothetical protein QVL70_03975, partial [Bartonella henselae]|uniref:hypothetical protein n=1 Tax=Bartonella henselae TaxID=38323 RepID=UPI0025AB3B12